MEKDKVVSNLEITTENDDNNWGETTETTTKCFVDHESLNMIRK